MEDILEDLENLNKALKEISKIPAPWSAVMSAAVIKHCLIKMKARVGLEDGELVVPPREQRDMLKNFISGGIDD